MARLDFDATTYDPNANSPRDPLPAGWYPVRIRETEMRNTRAGTGVYLQLTLEVIDGAHKGRRLWDRMNLSNPNETAVEIGRRQLAGYCHATGVLRLTDSDQLVGKTLKVRVVVKDDPTYGPSNEVKGMEPLIPGASGAAPDEDEPFGNDNGNGGGSNVPPWL